MLLLDVWLGLLEDLRCTLIGSIIMLKECLKRQKSTFLRMKSTRMNPTTQIDFTKTFYIEG